MRAAIPRSNHTMLATAIALITLPAMSWAKLYTVTSPNDAGQGTLRTILQQIPTESQGNEIIFNLPDHSRVIHLTSGEILLNKSVRIDGGKQGITLNANGKSRVIQITQNKVVTLANLTITKGYLHNYIADSDMGKTVFGAGILNYGVLTLDHVLIKDNWLIADMRPNLKSAPRKAAAALDGFNLGNLEGGGGICNKPGATLHIMNSTLNNNGIAVASGFGGGVQNAGNMIIQNSAILDNSLSAAVGWGGGIANVGQAAIINSTIAQNYVGSSGWGFNYGSGLYNGFGGKLSVSYSTIKHNLRGDEMGNSHVDWQQLFNDTEHSPAGQAWLNHTVWEHADRKFFVDLGNNYLGSDAKLGPLTDNGGPTLTFQPLPGSPLIDAGKTNCTMFVDQRGMPRSPKGRCDIGAVEVK
ncbi:choice-of-anchor Q domain-containing protein [Chitinivorax sp. B]|uniref:choice-of-anchor Q domain-containing protein n=1 Tax=Chitinivorax sp. B TaxID=2502235 RepID=UPI0010F6979F|nr:choice-of-anchor Q domain-containing protein [Chitinivorax sp. B]